MEKLTRVHYGWQPIKIYRGDKFYIMKIYKNKCIYCGNEFEATHKEARFCNSSCSNKYRYKNNIDKNVFDSWNENNAYMFGLIMSDGCLTHNKKRNIIIINSNDKKIIEILHSYVECKRKIYSNRKSYSLYYWNEAAVVFLRNYGLIERKSLIVKYPYNLPHEYQKDFIRGYFDGNGSIIYNKTIYNTYPRISIITGSKEFAYGLSSTLFEFSIFNHVYEYNRTGNYNYCVSITKIEDVKKFKNFIYSKDTEFKLDRKYNKMSLVDNIEKVYQ